MPPDSSNRRRIGQSLLGRSGATLIVLTIIYAVAMSAVMRELPRAEDLSRLGTTLFLACGLTSIGLLLRYVRWRWLLARHHQHTSFLAGLPAYFAGFALTATPGKVGELLRIRYFSQMGVPASRVISCFVFELSTDLVALMILSVPTVIRIPATMYALVFAVFLLAVICSMARSRGRYRLIRSLRRAGRRRIARTISKVGRGISMMSRLADLRTACVALGLGLMAWACQSYGLILIVSSLGFSASSFALISVMPAAMLLGAASLVPGGMGATEAAAIFLLRQLGADLQLAALAVIAVRVTSLWFATLVGFCAALVMEQRGASGKIVPAN